MKLVFIAFWVVGSSLWQSALKAETLEVEYASFYSHVKKLDTPETNALRFAFGFMHIAEKRLCHINNAQIITQKQTIPLIVENNNRFTVPVDKILKIAKAKVEIELDDQANKCDMSVQLETLASFLKEKYNQDELLFLFNQYQAFFEKMGGFLSFLMPSATGLSFHFEPEVKLSNNLQSLQDENGVLVLSENWMQQNTLELPEKPLRVTSFVEK